MTTTSDTPLVTGPTFAQATGDSVYITPTGGNQDTMANLMANFQALNLTSTGNGADTTEDTLATYSLPANTLGTTMRGLKIRAWGTCAANADNKTMKLYFGSEVITTPTAATNAKNWWLEMEVYHSGANAQVVLGRGIVDTTSVTPLVTTGAESESAAIVIKCTGTAGTGNANDIVIKAFVIERLD